MSFPMAKEQNFLADPVKTMPLTSEREIAADNGMWLTYPSHLEQVSDCQKKRSAQSSRSRAIAKILNALNNSCFVADINLLTKN